MKLCVETGAFQRMPMERALEEIRRAGYEYVELNPDLFKPHEATEADVERLRGLLQENGLKPAAVLALYPLASPDDETRRQAVENWKRAIYLSRILGAESLTSEMTGDPARADECRQAFLRSVEALLPLLEEANLCASFEPHPGDFIERSDEAVDLIRNINSRRVGYLYCMAHTFWLGEDAPQMVRYAGGTLRHVHVADTHRPERIIQAGQNARPHNHFIPGWGEVDFASTFRALLEVGYDGYLSAALFSHLDEPGMAVAETRERVSALLAKLSEK